MPYRLCGRHWLSCARLSLIESHLPKPSLVAQRRNTLNGLLHCEALYVHELFEKRNAANLPTLTAIFQLRCVASGFRGGCQVVNSTSSASST